MFVPDQTLRALDEVGYEVPIGRQLSPLQATALLMGGTFKMTRADICEIEKEPKIDEEMFMQSESQRLKERYPNYKENVILHIAKQRWLDRLTQTNMLKDVIFYSNMKAKQFRRTGYGYKMYLVTNKGIYFKVKNKGSIRQTIRK